MTFAPYIATLRKLTAAQLATEVAARLKAFNEAEETRKGWAEIEDARRRYVLAVREAAKRGEVKQ